MVSLVTGTLIGGLIAGGTGAAPDPPLTGLVARFRADTEVTEDTGGVSAWGDPVGGFDLAQATEANRPALVAGVINGHPVIRFTLANNDHLSRAVTPAENQPYAWVIVAAHPIASGAGQWAVSSTFAFRCVGYDSSDRPQMFAGSTLADNVALDANFHTVVGNFNSASSEIFVDGASVVTGDASTGNIAGLIIGAGAVAAGDPFGGDIAEVFLYDHVLDAGEIAAMDTYVAARYGI